MSAQCGAGQCGALHHWLTAARAGHRLGKDRVAHQRELGSIYDAAQRESKIFLVPSGNTVYTTRLLGVDGSGTAEEFTAHTTLRGRDGSSTAYELDFTPVADLSDMPETQLEAVDNAYLRRLQALIPEDSRLLGAEHVLSIDNELVLVPSSAEAQQHQVGRKGLGMMPSVRTTRRTVGEAAYLVARAKTKCMSLDHMAGKLAACRGDIRDFLGCSITTMHGARQRRSYLIAGLDSQRAGDYTFEHQGSNISVVQYFAQQYRITVPPDDYLLKVIPRRDAQKIGKRALARIAEEEGREGHRPLARIPASTARLVGMSGADQRDSEARRDMVRVASIVAPEARRRTEAVVAALQRADASLGGAVEVAGKYMGPAKLHAAQGKARFQAQSIQSKPDGNFTLGRGGSISAGVDWGAEVGSDFIVAATEAAWRDLGHVMGGLERQLRAMGVGLAQAAHILRLEGRGEGTQWLDLIASTYEEAPAENKPRFVIVVLARQDEALYYGVKAYSIFGRLPIPSQFVIAQNFEKKADKLAVQLSAKLNRNVYGCPELPAVMQQLSGKAPYMVAGVDTAPGVATLTFTLDASLCQTATVFADCPRGSSRLPVGELLLRALALWNRNTLKSSKVAASTGGRGYFPTCVYLYRTGASQGVLDAHVRGNQPLVIEAGDEKDALAFEEVLGAVRAVPTEAEQLCFVLSRWDAYTGVQPQLGYAVIQADTDVRLWDGESPGGSANVPNGTVVDSTIVAPDSFVYVPCETHMAMGRPIEHKLVAAVGPTLSTALQEGPDGDAVRGLLQRATRDFCSLYFNWQGPVRLPAPLAKAKRAAELIAECLSKASGAVHACAAAATQGGSTFAPPPTAPAGMGDSGIAHVHSVAGQAGEQGFSSLLAQLADLGYASALALGQYEL